MGVYNQRQAQSQAKLIPPVLSLRSSYKWSKALFFILLQQELLILLIIMAYENSEHKPIISHAIYDLLFFFSLSLKSSNFYHSNLTSLFCNLARKCFFFVIIIIYLFILTLSNTIAVRDSISSIINNICPLTSLYWLG